MAERASNFAHCEALVREGDPDRYWASLFAPADRRRHLHALYAFNFEVARVRESVREALMGEIRLQWWRDALQGEVRGDVRANPVAAALDETIVRFRLPRDPLVGLVDARVFDLYDDPMPSLADLRAVARRHLDLARPLMAAVPAPVRSAFRPLALVEPYLRQTERRNYDPFRTAVELPRWRRLAALWRGR